MNIKKMEVSIRELVNGYKDNEEEGVVGYSGQLDIRPPYQREFVYGEKEAEEVIHTVMRGLPLNVMYWVDRGDNREPDTPRYEVMDGQQRTIAICRYFNSAFPITRLTKEFGAEALFFPNLPVDKQSKFLDYPLFVYVCTGTDSEKLEWFRIINIAGKQLTDQELRNAVYAGPWISDAKRYFSKSNCPAATIAGKYLSGERIRQAYLETAIKWIASRESISIDEYMGKHQFDSNANELWQYFRSVIDWVERVFRRYRKEMKGLPWGEFYNTYHATVDFNPESEDLIEPIVRKLMEDDDVTRKSGIYEYVLSDETKESALNIRLFDERTKRETYEKQRGRCAICGREFDLNNMHADHIQPWSKGGQTRPENCQMLCRDCNLKKSNQVL